MSRIVQVCIPNTHRDFFDYEDGGLNPAIGARVWVPFRNKQRLGVVVSKNDVVQTKATLKAIDALIDQAPIFDSAMLDLCLWISSYYQSPLSEVLPLALPKKYRLGQPAKLPTIEAYQLAVDANTALQQLPERASKLRALIETLATAASPLCKPALSQLGFTSTSILRLLQEGLILRTETIDRPSSPKRQPSLPHPLNEEQQNAVDCIGQHLHQHQCFLLQGVTGSGKTEVYLQVIDKVLALGKQVLILVPEIGLTPQLLSRFSSRFNQPIAVLHSNLNETERQNAWQLAKDAQVQLVIGTRTAVFTPMPKLGLIVIDEEHDTSLKQMEGVRYSARDTALMRAHRANIPVILGTATPSLESLNNALQQKYTLLRLTQKAVATQPLHYALIDLRTQTLQQGLAQQTLERIKVHLQKKQQVLVFINRRGFAPVMLCHQCGWMADCRACDSHMTYHKTLGQLICHHCGLTQNMPKRCLSCKSDELVPVGGGTQRIQEFLQSYFPAINVLRIDRDEVSRKHAFEQHLDAIHKGEAQLIIGTQMLAKGHHFPNLSLVVILDADAGFFNPDFRAQEQLGQLLTQVAGRAGREDIPGEVLLQTHQPDHPMLNLLIQKGYDAFAQELLNIRHQAKLPPYHYLALIRAQGRHLPAVQNFLRTTREHLQNDTITIMGPAPAPLPKKAHQHRQQLLIKSASRQSLKQALTAMRQSLTSHPSTKGIQWSVDVDPQDLS